MQVHGYDKTATVTPDRAGVVTFVADRPGLYEVEVEEEGLQLFQILIR